MRKQGVGWSKGEDWLWKRLYLCSYLEHQEKFHSTSMVYSFSIKSKVDTGSKGQMETALKMTEGSTQKKSGEEEEGSWPELEQRLRPYVGAKREGHTVKDVNNMKKRKWRIGNGFTITCLGRWWCAFTWCSWEIKLYPCTGPHACLHNMAWL